MELSPNQWPHRTIFFLVVKSLSSYKMLCCTSTEHFISQTFIYLHY